MRSPGFTPNVPSLDTPDGTGDDLSLADPPSPHDGAFGFRQAGDGGDIAISGGPDAGTWQRIAGPEGAYLFVPRGVEHGTVDINGPADGGVYHIDRQPDGTYRFTPVIGEAGSHFGSHAGDGATIDYPALPDGREIRIPFGPDYGAPAYLTVDASGNVGADFSGHVRAQGVDLLAGDTSLPGVADSHAVSWHRPTDDALESNIYAFRDEGAAGAMKPQRLRLENHNLDDVDLLARLSLDTDGDDADLSQISATMKDNAGTQRSVRIWNAEWETSLMPRPGFAVSHTAGLAAAIQTATGNINHRGGKVLVWFAASGFVAAAGFVAYQLQVSWDSGAFAAPGPETAVFCTTVNAHEGTVPGVAILTPPTAQGVPGTVNVRLNRTAGTTDANDRITYLVVDLLPVV